MSAKPKPGGVITVKVGGVEYETVISSSGVQRFRKNEVIDFLFNSGKLDLNQLVYDYHAKRFSQRDYAELYMMLGYSVCGFCDVSSFGDMEIENPLWEGK